jgi:hypothetical protein
MTSGAELSYSQCINKGGFYIRLCCELFFGGIAIKNNIYRQNKHIHFGGIEYYFYIYRQN